MRYCDKSSDLINFFSRQTRTVSVFPVGLVGALGLSSPVRLNGAVTTFYDSFYSGRTFRLDMAGFAVNLEYFRYSSNCE